MHNQLFASFLLDETEGLEIALKAENVTEATAIQGNIQHLPASIDYLEGIMNLRNDIIPVINLKKRLGLKEHSYNGNAKVAVIKMHSQQYGLLFDDIREVFSAENDNIMPINSLLQTEDRIISSIIKLDQGKRPIELLDIGHLFKGQSFDMISNLTGEEATTAKTEQKTYSRWVVFRCCDQDYGVPVQYSQEIAFFSEINDMFKSGNVEGAIQLRGHTIPVMNGRFLLNGGGDISSETQDNRVLVLASDDCSFGLMVDEIKEILTIADQSILPVPSKGSDNLMGVYSSENKNNIMLLDMPNLVCNQIDDIKSLSRINGNKEDDQGPAMSFSKNRHLITENCYLIFAIHKAFAIELKDVQEIIEGEDIMHVPGGDSYTSAFINLRGAIVPVVNVRKFYGYPESENKVNKLIICRGQSQTIALEVDQIVTIYKQEEYHSTPSLHPQLASKKDTLDRLIEYENEENMREHVLVINMHNLIRNHIEFKEEPKTTQSDQNIEIQS